LPDGFERSKGRISALIPIASCDRRNSPGAVQAILIFWCQTIELGAFGVATGAGIAPFRGLALGCI
jgi:hypothetical protein